MQAYDVDPRRDADVRSFVTTAPCGIPVLDFVSMIQ